MVTNVELVVVAVHVMFVFVFVVVVQQQQKQQQQTTAEPASVLSKFYTSCKYDLSH